MRLIHWKLYSLAGTVTKPPKTENKAIIKFLNHKLDIQEMFTKSCHRRISNRI